MSIHKSWTSRKKISRLSTTITHKKKFPSSKIRWTHSWFVTDLCRNFSCINTNTILAGRFWDLIGQRKYPQLGRMEGFDFAEQQTQRRGQRRMELRQKKWKSQKIITFNQIAAQMSQKNQKNISRDGIVVRQTKSTLQEVHQDYQRLR